MQTHVKICGITNTDDARTVAAAGADYLGIIVDIEGSPRSVSIQTACTIKNSSGIPVVLLVEKTCPDIIQIASTVKPYGLQLIGNYTPEETAGLKHKLGCAVWKTVRVPREKCTAASFEALHSEVENHCRSGIDAVILDTMVEKQKGGTGCICDWDTAEKLVNVAPVPVFLAGGITPENVLEAVKKVRPFGIDLSSGVELQPGKKDPEKVTRLLKAVKQTL